VSGSPDRHPELPLDPDPADDGYRDLPRPVHLKRGSLTLVAVGGFVGALARYGISLLEPTRTGRWPIATFAVNLAGAFILGVLLEALARSGADAGWRQHVRLLIGTGFCGALTTYSTLAVEADLLLRDRHTGLALLYLLISLIGGLVLTSAGIAVAAGQHHWRRQRRSQP
jgi:CrcB protein